MQYLGVGHAWRPIADGDHGGAGYAGELSDVAAAGQATKAVTN